jgi:hypothetical protein
MNSISIYLRIKWKIQKMRTNLEKKVIENEDKPFLFKNNLGL